MCWSCKNKFCSPVCLETHSDQCHVWRKRQRLEAAADAAVGAASEQAAVAAGCPAGAAPELAAAAEQAVGAADTAAAGAGGQASSPAVEQAALDAACEVVQEDGLFKVICRHASAEYVLGLFVSLDEAHRVCDVLTIKAAVDVHGDLVALKLNLDLSRYTERSDFSDDEIRPHAVSFCQPHRQLYTPSATSQSLTLRA
ncbi:hypothetical protein D9Q98_003798 [Chlorella vulgaris]|uniref:C2H2-type domain-containing protein n=1 Tax=Chlorella vulgaris TaxID=3077 RepID=A0A9D4YY06_CHLVU|nr:hypothetical protein D9Q98_003795 [Chlorella vulgaris]KAI3432237.1 hypothetical protein D9Q98_003798 [Chlorella vulgaris]